MNHAHAPKCARRSLTAGLLVALVLLSSLACHSEELHRWVHTDSQSPAHHCLVTILELGGSDMAASWESVAPLEECAGGRGSEFSFFFPASDLTLPQTRGPPAGA